MCARSRKHTQQHTRRPAHTHTHTYRTEYSAWWFLHNRFCEFYWILLSNQYQFLKWKTNLSVGISHHRRPTGERHARAWVRVVSHFVCLDKLTHTQIARGNNSAGSAMRVTANLGHTQTHTHTPMVLSATTSPNTARRSDNSCSSPIHRQTHTHTCTNNGKHMYAYIYPPNKHELIDREW